MLLILPSLYIGLTRVGFQAVCLHSFQQGLARYTPRCGSYWDVENSSPSSTRQRAIGNFPSLKQCSLSPQDWKKDESLPHNTQEGERKERNEKKTFHFI